MKDFIFNFASSFEEIEFIKPLKVRSITINKNTFLKIEFNQSSLMLSTLHELNPQFHQNSLYEIQRVLMDFFSMYKLNFEQVNFNKSFFNFVDSSISIETRFFTPELMYHIEVTLLFLMKELNIPVVKNDLNLRLNDLSSSQESYELYKTSSCLKFKISPPSQKEDLEYIHSLNRSNPQCLWRFDGNRQWELEELISFCDQLPSQLNVDYFEEPFKNFSDRYLFEKRYDYKIALDESLETLFPHLELFKQSPLVFKPSLFGISSLHQWINQHPDQRVIISSSYEHPSAMIGLKLLSSLKSLEYHGLSNFIKTH